MAYFGHLEKVQVLESLKADEASSIIITLDNVVKKRLICDAILKYKPNSNIVLKINNFNEKREFEDLDIDNFVHAHNKIASLLVKKSL